MSYSTNSISTTDQDIPWTWSQPSNLTNQLFFFQLPSSFFYTSTKALASALHFLLELSSIFFNFLLFFFFFSFSFSFLFTVPPWVILPHLSNHVPVLLKIINPSQPHLADLSLRARPIAFCTNTHCISFHQEQQKQQLLQLTQISLAIHIWSTIPSTMAISLTIQMLSPVFH